MLRIILIRPGATEFDDQGRIKGSLDMPLSEHGRQQVTKTAAELAAIPLEVIYTAPCESARATADLLADHRHTRVKVIDGFRNVDHGLWHGKLIDDVRRHQPRVYRQGQDAPDSLCPPGGEPIQAARARVIKALQKIYRKHRRGVVALVIPDPLASVVGSMLCGDELRDLWKAETDGGRWELIEPQQTVQRHPALA